MRDATSKVGSVSIAAAKVAPRQLEPIATDAPRARGPSTAPSEPARTHLPMFRSVEFGSRSIHVAWARLTNAPEAG
jgi:hypothetical protein